MKPSQLALVALTEAAASIVTFEILRLVGSDKITISFIVGAGVASYVGFYLLHRAGRAATGGATALLGGTIAVACLTVGIGIHAIYGMQLPEIVLPIAMVGSFVFPFVLRGTATRAFASMKRK